MKHYLNYFFTMLIGIAVGIAAYGSYQSHNYHMTTEKPEPEIQYVYIESEPEVITEVVTEVVTETVTEIEHIYIPCDEPFYLNFTEREEWCLKDLGMREAEGEGVIGICWVMYTVLCRCQAFGTTIEQEWASSAYTSMDRSGKTPNEDCLKAFELIREGWTPKPLWFRRGNYHENLGSPLCQVGNHCFSM